MARLVTAGPHCLCELTLLVVGAGLDGAFLRRSRLTTALLP